MPDKIGTFGAKLYKTSIASANEIGNLISIGELDFTRPTTDSTTHADAVRRKLKGVRNVEPLTVRIAYDPQDADHIALLLTDVQAATPHSADPTWVFTVKSNGLGTKKASFTFTGFISSFKLGAWEIEGMQVAEITFEVDGDVTPAPDDTTTP